MSRVTLAQAQESLAKNAAWTAKNGKLWPTGTSPLAAIRRKCVDCVAGEVGQISDCHIRSCALWPYRMGRNPFHGRADQD